MDFTLPSALLFIAKTKPKSEEEIQDMKNAQEVVRNSGLSTKEIKEKTKEVIKQDKADKKIIKYQQMSSKQKYIVDNIGKMGIGMKGNKGGLTKPKMMYGGVANKKKHNYAAGGSVKDRLGIMIAVGKIKPNNG